MPTLIVFSNGEKLYVEEPDFGEIVAHVKGGRWFAVRRKGGSPEALVNPANVNYIEEAQPGRAR